MVCALFIAAFTPAARSSKLLFSLFNEDFRRDFVSEKITQTKLLAGEWLLAADFLKKLSF